MQKIEPANFHYSITENKITIAIAILKLQEKIVFKIYCTAQIDKLEENTASANNRFIFVSDASTLGYWEDLEETSIYK